MSGTLVCYVSLGQSQPLCQMSFILVHLFVMSLGQPALMPNVLVWCTCLLCLLNRASPYAKCPYVWYTCLLCHLWTEPSLMPNVLMSGTHVCYVTRGQSQPLCKVSLCLVHLFVSLMFCLPYAKCPYVWYTCLFCLSYVLSPLCQMSLCLVHLFVLSPLRQMSLCLVHLCVMSVLNRARPLCQMSLCLVHLCVMSVLDRTRPLCQIAL